MNGMPYDEAINYARKIVHRDERWRELPSVDSPVIEESERSCQGKVQGDTQYQFTKLNSSQISHREIASCPEGTYYPTLYFPPVISVSLDVGAVVGNDGIVDVTDVGSFVGTIISWSESDASGSACSAILFSVDHCPALKAASTTRARVTP